MRVEAFSEFAQEARERQFADKDHEVFVDETVVVEQPMATWGRKAVYLSSGLGHTNGGPLILPTSILPYMPRMMPYPH
jgi:hypothetical protein